MTTAMTVLLVVLTVVTLGILMDLDRTGTRIARASHAVTAQVTLQRAVTEQALAVTEYRRTPGATTRGAWDDALEDLGPALSGVRADGDAADRAVADQVAGLAGRSSQPLDVVTNRLTQAAFLARGAQGREERLIADQRSRQRLLTGWLFALLSLTLLVALGLCGQVWSTRPEASRRRVAVPSHDERALTDPLTGLPNRASLDAAMQEAFARPRTQAALLHLDLDRFRSLNDTLGHGSGDIVLKEVASRLRSCIRAGELAVRIGGDEFAVFLPRGRDAAFVARRVLAAFEDPFYVAGESCDVGVSIGLAYYPLDAADAPMLMAAADEALYRAKRAGRGRIQLARMSQRARRAGQDSAVPTQRGAQVARRGPHR